jgi:hypothetical protein
MPEAQPTVVWRPLPGSQTLAMACRAHHILLEGSRGPGKSDAQIMRFRMRVGLGYGKFWRGIIFDREYKALDDLISKTQRWFPQFGDGAEFVSSGSYLLWRWPSGEELRFRRIKKAAEYAAYHGHEYPWIGWNELTKYPTSEMYDLMMSCNRSSFLPSEHPLEDGTLLPEIPLEVVSTTNPHGPGHGWCKRKFVDAGRAGEVLRSTTNVFNPRTQKREDIVKTQVRIFGSYRENRYLSPEYVAELENIKDPNRKRAWLSGDWDITAGGALDDLWKSDVVILPRFKVPAAWHLDRSFDWGSSHPFSVGWWAEANGEEATLPDGRTFCPQPGSLIRIHEWYGTVGVGTNQGLRMSATTIAQGIVEREKKLKADGFIARRVYPGPADNQIFDVREEDVDTIAKKMADQGVEWTRSDKSNGSRKNGLELTRDRLEASEKREGPGLYFMNHCQAAIGTLPVLPRDPDDPDDVDTDSEDHPYDDVRYRVLAGANRAATTLKVGFAS